MTKSEAQKRIALYKQHAQSDMTGNADQWVNDQIAEQQRTTTAIQAGNRRTYAQSTGHRLVADVRGLVKRRVEEGWDQDEVEGTENFVERAREDEASAAQELHDYDPHIIPALRTVQGRQAQLRHDMGAALQDHPVGRRYATRSLSVEAMAAVQHEIDLALNDENATVGLARVLRVMRQHDPEPARDAVPLNYDDMRKHLDAVANVVVPEVDEGPTTHREAFLRGLNEMPLEKLEELKNGELRRGKPERKEEDTRSLADLEAAKKRIESEERDRAHAVPDFDDVADGYARFFPKDDSAIKIVD